jgi:hypothetical protein
VSSIRTVTVAGERTRWLGANWILSQEVSMLISY